MQPSVHLLDYVAGNTRSLVNAIEKVGYRVEWVRSPEDLENVQVSLIHDYWLLVESTFAKIF